MRRFLMGLLAGTALGCTFMVGAAVAKSHGLRLPTIEIPRSDWRKVDMPALELPNVDVMPVVESARRAIHRALPPPEPTAVNVVLLREGQRVFAGPDHSRPRLSSILIPHGRVSMDVPGFRGSDRSWQALNRCVRDRFSGFAVNVMDEAPNRGDYIGVRFGGSATELGLKSSVQGLAPYTGRVMPNASVFVFDHGGPSTTTLCEVAAHEIGHALGLDHSRLCSDVMSYRSCGPKRFRERPARCGEYEARPCWDGSASQSSAATLAAHVGRRPQRPAIS